MLSLPVCAAVFALGCGGTVVKEDSGSGTTSTETGSTNTGGAAGSTDTGGNGTTTTPTTTTIAECTTDANCFEPDKPICDVTQGICVGCIPALDPSIDCGIGQYCEPDLHTCVLGCTGDVDCGGAPGLLCDLEKHACVGCTGDDTCPPDSVCDGGTCVPGCSQTKACSPGLSCCFGQCYNLDSDVDNCGMCSNVCDMFPYQAAACEGGICAAGECDPGRADCDAQPLNGCEHNLLADGPCACVPGEVKPCYAGMPGTEGVGLCHAGTQGCNMFGTGWDACTGMVLPAPEICGDGADEDCNGIVDDGADADQDGFTTCDNDCDDNDPQVNPGALEVTWTLVDDDSNPNTPMVEVNGTGNGKDDDCRPQTPDLVLAPTCSSLPKSADVIALDLANALDLCDPADVFSPKAQQRWGLLSAQLLRPDGTLPSPQETAVFQNTQVAVRYGYGTFLPKRGPTLAALSSGAMRAPGEAGYVAPSPGKDLGFSTPAPTQYLAKHNGALPSTDICGTTCPPGTGTFDGVSLRLSILVPTNTTELRYDTAFFSAEYPSTCSGRNDASLAIIATGAPGIFLPADRNIALGPSGQPFTASSASFFDCALSGCNTCLGGTGPLAGTAMPASTDWVQVKAPVVPGETMTLDIMVFDATDGAGDSVVLVDNMRFRYVAPCINCGP